MLRNFRLPLLHNNHNMNNNSPTTTNGGGGGGGNDTIDCSLTAMPPVFQHLNAEVLSNWKTIISMT